jgi:hypothetical protein
VLNERAAYPLALKLREYSQRREDGSPSRAGSSRKNRLGEQDVPDWLVPQESQQRQARLCCGVLEQVGHQRRLVFTRKGGAFDAQYNG